MSVSFLSICSVLLSVFSLTCVALDFTDYSGCVFTLNDSNNIASTYNLSLFHLTDDIYRVSQDDSERTTHFGWEYLFNICGKIPLSVWNDRNVVLQRCYNDTSKVHGPCSDWDDDGSCLTQFNAQANNITASALQYTTKLHCHWVGMELDGQLGSSMPDYNVSLLDPDDSASGIKYTILNGDACYGDQKQNRELTVEFVCPDSNREFFDPIDELNISELVVQYPSCVYTLTYETALACPRECLTVDTSLERTEGDLYSVCNGRGICVADPNYGRSRCMCDTGFAGSSCEYTDYDIQVISTANNDNSIAVITWICVVLLIFGLIFAVVLCHRIRVQEKFIVGQQDKQVVQSMLGNGNENDIHENAMGVTMGVQAFPPSAANEENRADPPGLEQGASADEAAPGVQLEQE